MYSARCDSLTDHRAMQRDARISVRISRDITAWLRVEDTGERSSTPVPPDSGRMGRGDWCFFLVKIEKISANGGDGWWKKNLAIRKVSPGHSTFVVFLPN